MTLRRPLPQGFVSSVANIVGESWCLSGPAGRWAYSYDASLLMAAPDLVALPADEAQVAALVCLCHDQSVPYLARGAGTGLTGGAVAIDGGLVIALARLKRVIEVDARDRWTWVEPGVVNLELQEFLAPLGLTFIPDPSSQRVSTIGGNVANNSGGPHCLAYGVTANHVMGLRVVLPDGAIVTLGGPWAHSPGLDLTGLFVGSEGTLGIITAVLCRLTVLPETVGTLLAGFSTLEAAAGAVERIIASGSVPAALEMLEGPIIAAVERSVGAGYPVGAEAVLLVEVEGLAEVVPARMQRIRAVLESCGAEAVQEARDAQQRARLWSGRKGAIGAAAQLAPRYYLQDGVVPRTRLLEVLQRVRQIAKDLDVGVVNVFHAGDGNLHPLVLFDPADVDQTHRAAKASGLILRACVDLGGTISGEHGIGLEKSEFMPWILGPDDLEAMARVRAVFDPSGLCNPGKIFPSPGRCHEVLKSPDLGLPGGLWI